MVHAAGNDDQEPGTAALEKLAAELGGRGFETRLAAPEGRVPSLQVTNPQATALTENVVAGDGWLWWSWAERIGSVDDVAGVASRIAQVLGGVL